MFINIRNDRIWLGVRCLRTLERASLLSGGGLLHALQIIRLFAACEAGTRRGHYSGYSLLVLDCGRSNERPYCQDDGRMWLGCYQLVSLCGRPQIRTESTLRRIHLPVTLNLSAPKGVESFITPVGRVERAQTGESAVNNVGLCQKSDFGPAYHKLGSYQVSI